MKLRWIAVPLVLVAALAASHTYQVIEGIHFKAQGENVDFGLPPHRFSDIYTTYLDAGAKTWRPGTEYLGEQDVDRYLHEYRNPERQANQKALYRKAYEAEIRRDYGRALRIYREMTRRGLGSPGFVRARIDLLKEVGRRDIGGLTEYLEATAKEKKPAELPKKTDPTLAPFVAYEEAMRVTEATSSAARFVRVAQRFPDSSRAPASLIMAARRLTQEGRTAYAIADLRLASHAVQALLTEYPESRFAWAARGERGRIEFLQKRYVPAISRYESQVRLARDRTERRKALTSILLCADALGRRDAVATTCLRLMPWAKDRLHVVKRLEETMGRFNARDARRFGQRLRNDPSLLTEYLEYRADFTKPTKELYRFATTPGISGLALARLSEIALKLKDAPKASRFAHRALRRRDRNDSRAIATFVLASVDRRAGRTRAARDRYASLLDRWPKSYLAGGARENLAMLEERLGNLGKALDHYTALEYFEDFAYMIDARMSTGQLARYIATRPKHPRRTTLIYTLGMRYLREGKWSRAEATFGRLTERRRRLLTSENREDLSGTGLQDPLATLRALRRLDRQIQAAKGRKARAAALYAMGDYYYQHRNLLLYSLPAWQMVRAEVFGYSWNRGAALAADDRALPRHHDEHEADAHALRLFQRVVREYPETPIAPRAAYWGACAAQRLSNFNPYWRWRTRDARMIGEAVRLMRFAERNEDPSLAARARKYHRVFRDQYTGERMAFANLKAPERRYTGGW